MDPAREPRDPVPEGQPGAARDATREPAREPRPSTPPGQPGAAGDRTDATRAPTGQHRVVFEVLAEPPPKPMKRIEFAIDGRAAAEEEAQRMSVREWFAGAGDDVLTYDQVMAKLPPPLPRDDPRRGPTRPRTSARARRRASGPAPAPRACSAVPRAARERTWTSGRRRRAPGVEACPRAAGSAWRACPSPTSGRRASAARCAPRSSGASGGAAARAAGARNIFRGDVQMAGVIWLFCGFFLAPGTGSERLPVAGLAPSLATRLLSASENTPSPQPRSRAGGGGVA